MLHYAYILQYCATCQFWTGSRRAERDEGRVYTPRHATIGACDCPTGHWRGRLKPGESNCPHWQTWATMEGAADPRKPPKQEGVGDIDA